MKNSFPFGRTTLSPSSHVADLTLQLDCEYSDMFPIVLKSSNQSCNRTSNVNGLPRLALVFLVDPGDGLNHFSYDSVNLFYSAD